MGRFRHQLLLDDNTRGTRHFNPKNIRHSILSAQWTLISNNFVVENYGFIEI